LFRSSPAGFARAPELAFNRPDPGRPFSRGSSSLFGRSGLLRFRHRFGSRNFQACPAVDIPYYTTIPRRFKHPKALSTRTTWPGRNGFLEYPTDFPLHERLGGPLDRVGTQEKGE